MCHFHSNFHTTSGILLILLLMTVVIWGFSSCDSTESNQTSDLELVDSALERVQQAIAQGNIEKIAFDETTQQALENQEIGYVFQSTVIRASIAEKFAQLYRDRDWAHLVEYLSFLDANHTVMLTEGAAFDICFSPAFLSDLSQFIIENGTFLESTDKGDFYTYQEAEFMLSSFVYIKWNYPLEGEIQNTLVILGDSDYRRTQHTTYNESSNGYFLVDKLVEAVDSKLSASASSSDTGYYPAGVCSNCGYSYRANHIRAIMAAKYGYCGLGLCGKN